jgi:mannonate dehydratase
MDEITMKQAWRWFGPVDRVSIDQILQVGATDVVSALHHVPTGAVWSVEDIAKRKEEVSTMTDGSPSGLCWSVIESLPVSESIKKQDGPWREHIENYKQSLKNLAELGITIVCYNFMPVLDWTRTDLAWQLPNGGTTMRFDVIDFAAFDIHILARNGAIASYSLEIIEAARDRFSSMDQACKNKLAENVSCGLPGAAERMSIEDVRNYLAQYDDITTDKLREHFVHFLEEVIPVAEEVGVNLCCHPDDPPFPLLGLPRIMSTEKDYRYILDAVDSRANGVTLCAGSLGARADNDLPGMIDRLGDRIHFLHLRNVRRDSSSVPTTFYEAEHLNGDNDIVAMMAALIRQEKKRKEEGREDWNIPVRPDHGQNILYDLSHDGQPGYPLVGRLKGLAELRGVYAALSSLMHNG